MELIAITVGALLLVAALVVWAFAAIAKRMPDDGRRRVTKSDRARNQTEVEEWIARTKGADHVRRMRGD